MANVSYDTLTIQINADSKQATSSIAKLSKNLQKLEEVAKSLDVKAITNAQKLLQDIANIDFTNVSKGLQDVVDAFRALNKMSNKPLKSMAIDPMEQAKAIEFMTGGGKGFAESDWSQGIQYTADDLLKAFGTATPYVERLTDANQKLKVQMWQVKDAMKETAKATKKIKDEAKQTANGLEKLVKAFKRIVFYRVVRRTIQLVAQELKEAIQELAKFDSQFNSSISQLKSSFSYLGRSIIAMLAPIINLLAPIISSITNQVGQLSNQIGQAFSGDKYSQAEQSAENYAKSLEKAKNATLGIDELNVISQDEDKTLFSEQDGGQATFLSVKRPSLVVSPSLIPKYSLIVFSICNEPLT